MTALTFPQNGLKQRVSMILTGWEKYALLLKKVPQRKEDSGPCVHSSNPILPQNVSHTIFCHHLPWDSFHIITQLPPLAITLDSSPSHSESSVSAVPVRCSSLYLCLWLWRWINGKPHHPFLPLPVLPTSASITAPWQTYCSSLLIVIPVATPLAYISFSVQQPQQSF